MGRLDTLAGLYFVCTRLLCTEAPFCCLRYMVTMYQVPIFVFFGHGHRWNGSGLTLISLTPVINLLFLWSDSCWKCTFYGPYFVEIGVKLDKYPNIHMTGHTFRNFINRPQKLRVILLIFSQINTCFIPGLQTIWTVWISKKCVRKCVCKPWLLVFVWCEAP